MTETKILTPQEALRALADGKKLTTNGWRSGQYIYLTDSGLVCDKNDAMVSLSRLISGYVIYTEPTPKKKVAPYYIHPEGHNTFLTSDCYENDDHAKNSFSSGLTFTRCTALEIEV